MFRINYGNGQVSRTFATFEEARRELLSLRTIPYYEWFRVQRYAGDGEWVGLEPDTEE